eukprot:7557487-Alexandrium_andersonii.AAC.1
MPARHPTPPGHPTLSSGADTAPMRSMAGAHKGRMCCSRVAEAALAHGAGIAVSSFLESGGVWRARISPVRAARSLAMCVGAEQSAKNPTELQRATAPRSLAQGWAVAGWRIEHFLAAACFCRRLDDL